MSENIDTPENIIYFQLMVKHNTDKEQPFAMVNYWINEQDSNVAYQQVVSEIGEQGWAVTDIQQAMITDRNSYSDPEQLVLFEKAVTEGKAYQIQTITPETMVLDEKFDIEEKES